MEQGIDFHRVRTLVGRELRDSLRDWRIVIPVFGRTVGPVGEQREVHLVVGIA